MSFGILGFLAHALSHLLEVFLCPNRMDRTCAGAFVITSEMAAASFQVHKRWLLAVLSWVFR